MNKLHTPFYLTGGTAISRAYFNHRYSDDLDFFVNADENFLKFLKKTIDEIIIYCKNNDIIFLKNKITALFRYEPKDIVDIWIIAKNTEFNWKEIIYQAKEKELGVEPITSAEIIQSFPEQKLELIKWKKEYSFEKIINDLNTISKDIITGSDNSLCKTNVDIENAEINI